MIQDKKVTIILPARNEPRFLRQSIESCLKQTYSNIELIIVDDSSTGTLIREIVKSFNDKRIKYFRNNSIKGISYCINTGFKKSEGSYIAWTADDNYFDCTAIEKMLTYLTKNNEKCVYTSFYCFKNDFSEKKSIVRLHDISLMARKCFSCLLFDRDVFIQTGPFDTNLYFTQYYDFLLRVLKNFNLSFLNEPLYYSRLHQYALSPADIKNFRYCIELILVQYKNGAISKAKSLESLMEAGIKYIAESEKGSFLLDMSVEKPALYKTYIMQKIDEMYFNKYPVNKSFKKLKAEIDKVAEKIENKMSGHKTGNVSARRRTVIDIMRFFLENGLYKLYEEFKFIIRNNFELDYSLFTNISYLEFNHKCSNDTTNENTFFKVPAPSNGSCLEPAIKKDFYSNLIKFKENNPYEYYFYRLKDEFVNSSLYNKPEDITSYMEGLLEFLNDSRTKRFILDKALSLASSNAEIAEVQQKIQEFYRSSL